MSSKKILTINGWFLVIAGFLLTTMTLLGRFTGNGILKALQAEPLGAIGMFEAFILGGIMGIVLLWAARNSASLKFWNLVACGVHLTFGTANILFWEDSFVHMQAEIPGTVVTIIHFSFVILEGLAALKTKPI